MLRSIPYMQIRGGSSKGLYFSAQDLPEDENHRDRVLLEILGSDHSQIDGLGGAHPLTSKVAVISPSSRADCDVDYLFAQIVVGENRVDTTPNCGNILAGVGHYALEKGLIKVENGETRVRVHMINSGNRCELILQTPGGKISYEGDTIIDGVPGSSAPVICNYLDIAGSVCGELFPTGSVVDEIDGIEVTCIDNGMPVVVISASDLGITGGESVDSLEADTALKTRLESIRMQTGLKMNLEDVGEKVVPKMCLVSSPDHGGLIKTRTFIPHTCHRSIGVLGAVSVATACLTKGTVASRFAHFTAEDQKHFHVEHPSGSMPVALTRDDTGQVIKAGIIRTARLLSKGEAYYLDSQN